MENEKKNNNSILLITMTVIALLFAAIGWMLGAKYANNETKDEKPKTEERNNQQELNKPNETTNIDIESLGRELFDRVSFNDGWKLLNHYPFISIDRSTIDQNFTDQIVLFNILKNIKKYDDAYDADKCSNSDFYNRIGENNTPDDSCIIIKISKEEFSNEYYKYFGQNPNFFSEKIDNQCLIECKLSNDGYTCYERTGGCGDDGECYGGYKYVSSILNGNNELVVEVEPYIDYCGDPEINKEEYIREYATSHLITFKQNENNDWYWYSTQSK